MLARFTGDPLRRCASDRKSRFHVFRMRLVRCLIAVRTSRPPGGLRGPQDCCDRQAQARVIDVHRGKAAFVMMRIPECQLLPTVGRMEPVVDVEHVAMARRHVMRKMVDQRAGELCCVFLCRRIVIESVRVTAADAEHARRDDLEERVRDARRITPIRQCFGHPRDDADLLLDRAQQQQARVQRLIAAVEIDCEFLARDGWQVVGKR
jgi:hypothetical protein